MGFESNRVRHSFAEGEPPTQYKPIETKNFLPASGFWHYEKIEAGISEGLMGAAFIGIAAVWLVLQAFALWKLQGGWRIAAWIPLVAMGAALAIAVLGALAGSNLAPIWVFLTLPLALLWMAVLWILRGIAWKLGR